MKPSTRLLSLLTLSLAGSGLAPLSAQVVFSEDFEAPVVSGFDDNTVPSGGRWIGSTDGFGATSRGLYNETYAWPATSAFTTPFGQQAYFFNYTNTALTTAVGATGQTLTAGVPYRVTFHTAVVAGATSGNYRVELVAFSATDTNTVRQDGNAPIPGTVLATATGSVTTTDFSATGSLSFTADGANAHLGKDLGIRLVYGGSNVLYDNIRLLTGHDLQPTPASGVTVPAGAVALGWTNRPPTVGSNVAVDVWFGTNPESMSLVLDGAINATSANVNAPVAGTYYWRIDTYTDGNPAGTPVTGDLFFFVVTDTDGDGLPDAYELAHTTPPSATSLAPSANPDDDGLTNAQEYFYGTNPNDSDTDNDTLLDGPELTGVGLRPATSPVDADSDDDGLSDGVETNTGTWVGASDTGTNPTDADWDKDGLKDGVETNTGTYVSRFNTGSNPFAVDTDNDGATDWYEATATFTNPSSAGETSPIPYPLPDPDGSSGVTNKPVKVYIMAGQSNTVGIGQVNGTLPGTLETIVKRENKFPNLLDASNNWTQRQDVLYRGVVSATASGPLAPGQGASSSQLGPELGFGHIMGWYHDEPVLIIKASQGNRSLAWDFLPPGSSQWEFNGYTYAGHGDSPDKWLTGTTPVRSGWYGGKQYDDCFSSPANYAVPPVAWASAVSYAKDQQVSHNGQIYTSKAAHTSDATTEPGVGASWGNRWTLYSNASSILANFATLYPQWAAQGYEIAGFCWWQGHKDQDGANNPYAARYQQNLVNLIHALRAEFNAPNAPVVVATIGFGGEPLATKENDYQQVYNAQMAVQGLPEFAGTVRSVDTLKYWRTIDESPKAQDFHYNQNAETYMLVGDAMGRAMLSMQDDTSPPSPDPMTFAIVPSAVNTITVGMVATTAIDVSGPVEYYFENTTTGAFRDWGTSTRWDNTGLTNGQTYSFRVKARDSKGNETAWSAPAQAAPAADTTAPSPNPMSFAAPPAELGENSITMTAATATDINGVEYYFDATDGGHDSGWQSSAAYTDTGLSAGTTYTYLVRARDAAGNITGDSAPAQATTTAPDLSPPAPDPLTFASAPAALGINAITMTASTATDASGVEYFFEAVSGGGTSSGWQNSPTYTDSTLNPGTEYGYRVRARDKSPAQNTGGWSATFTAMTETPDTTPPAPDPMTFAIAPAATGPNSISMTATTATDANAVEYYFECLSTGGHDSGWQTSPSYTDTGLQPETQYAYRVKARDTSESFNETAFSSSVAATTSAAPTGPGGALVYEDFAQATGTLNGKAGGYGLSSNWTAGTAVLIENPGLSFGSLPVSGNLIRNSGTGGTTQSVSIGNSLSSAGLLDDNSELWFAFLVNNPSGSNVSFDFVLGSGSVGFSGLPSGKQGIGVTLASGTGVRASTYNNGRSSSSTGSTLTSITTALIVGKLKWGATPGDVDTISVYRPAVDLVLPASPVATRTAVLDQTLFSTLSTYFKDANVKLDEIRFGSSYEAALGLVAEGPGPVDSFTISPIASPQTVGTPITGITITAKDAEGATATSFTGTVTFGGTGGFTGTSAAFTDGVLADVSVTPATAGSDLTLTVNDGAGHTGSATITTIRSRFETWSEGATFDSDTNGDGVEDGMAWVLGAGGPNEPASALQPTVDATSDADDKMLFVYRRRAAAAAEQGVTIICEYGTTLGSSPDSWTAALHEGTGPDDITITEEPNGFGDGIDRVTVALPARLADGDKLFTRLRVTFAP